MDATSPPQQGVGAMGGAAARPVPAKSPSVGTPVTAAQRLLPGDLSGDDDAVATSHQSREVDEARPDLNTDEVQGDADEGPSEEGSPGDGGEDEGGDSGRRPRRKNAQRGLSLAVRAALGMADEGAPPGGGEGRMGRRAGRAEPAGPAPPDAGETPAGAPDGAGGAISPDRAPVPGPAPATRGRASEPPSAGADEEEEDDDDSEGDWQNKSAEPQKRQSRSSRRGLSGASLRMVKQKWTDEEVDALRVGVGRFGVGRWRHIQNDPVLGAVLRSRSNVDLKDKWRNLTAAPNTKRRRPEDPLDSTLPSPSGTTAGTPLGGPSEDAQRSGPPEAGPGGGVPPSLPSAGTPTGGARSAPRRRAAGRRTSAAGTPGEGAGGGTVLSEGLVLAAMMELGKLDSHGEPIPHGAPGPGEVRSGPPAPGQPSKRTRTVEAGPPARGGGGEPQGASRPASPAPGAPARPPEVLWSRRFEERHGGGAPLAAPPGPLEAGDASRPQSRLGEVVVAPMLAAPASAPMDILGPGPGGLPPGVGQVLEMRSLASEVVSLTAVGGQSPEVVSAAMVHVRAAISMLQAGASEALAPSSLPPFADPGHYGPRGPGAPGIRGNLPASLPGPAAGGLPPLASLLLPPGGAPPMAPIPGADAYGGGGPALPGGGLPLFLGGLSASLGIHGPGPTMLNLRAAELAASAEAGRLSARPLGRAAGGAGVPPPGGSGDAEGMQLVGAPRSKREDVASAGAEVGSPPSAGPRVGARGKGVEMGPIVGMSPLVAPLPDAAGGAATGAKGG